MARRTAESITAWLEENLYRFDGPAQMLGTEPNAARRPWDAARVRWLLAASWDCSQAAGNMAIPAVYDALHKAPVYTLADRWYLPATQRDLALLERAGIPVFGIESRHQLADFDVVGTSISYTVLFMNFCNTGEAPIWMGDKSFKPISKVQAGDEVMGWEWPEAKDGEKQPMRRLRKAKVLRVVGRQAQVVRVTMESGKVIRCTPDHKWLSTALGPGYVGVDRWTHVGGSSTAYEYAEAGAFSTKYNTKPGSRTVLGTLAQVVEPTPELTPEQQREADWLAGVYDGEGHKNAIAQCSAHNPEMCARIESALDMLGIPWTISTQNGCCRQYRMRGGRRTYVHWLNWTNGVRREWFEQQIDGKRLGKRPDRVLKIEPDGVDTVYSMETETGNYVAWGLASSNCKYLTMSGVPLRWADRAERAGDYPMIMAGGQAWCAPEFMAPVVDCVWLGEVEEEPGNPGIAAVCERIVRFKEDGAWSADRNSCYLALAREFNFLYFPRFTGVTYRYEDRGLPEPTKMVSGYTSRLPGLPERHRARRVRNLASVSLMTSAPLLFTDPRMGSGDIEMMRGCTDWCVFCRLSWVTKPPREEPVAQTVRRAGTWLERMGAADISLVAPDPPAYSRKRELIAALLEHVTDRVDASSMRIDDYLSKGDDFSLLLQVSGTRSLTFGLEGGSQRTRDLAGKGASDEDVCRAVRAAISAGVRKIKLYFITNWPGEERADVMKVVELGKRLAGIRDEFGPAGRGVQLIFSWTPLLIEAQTPLQWFEVTAPDYLLKDALDELRQNRIWIKIGSKASPPKMAFFQACQRASRDVGEAITDVIEDYGTASWGGFPADMRERLDAAMVARGFRNGLADIFGERYYEDLLGWEMIDTGVSRELMWRAYSDMVTFLENTSAEAYDESLPEGHRGNEWVPRCDQQCSGASCGVCDREDLELRRDYVHAVDRDLTAQPVRPVDHTTVAQLARLQLERPLPSRFIGHESLEFILRRALYLGKRDYDEVLRQRERGPFPDIAAPSVRFASEGTGYRERSIGIDYAEFGLTRPADHGDAGAFLIKAARHLEAYLHWTARFALLPPAGRMPDRPLSLWELEVAGDPSEVAGRLRWWDGQETVPALVRADSFYTGETAQRGDAKEHSAGFWLARDGQRLVLRMLLNGRLGPYQLWAALMGRPSWIEAARYPARRLEFFSGGSWPCEGCGAPVPSSLLDVPWSERFCPLCADQDKGVVVASLERSGVLQVRLFTVVEEPVDSPGFSGTHQYGQPFGGFPADDEHWAGRGYDEVPDPATLEAAVVPA